ncbi:MAG TPA: M20/M25/M40 family metallo-hydrolase [Longimicrobiales bacterium]|nr:M20/M25/M40 family metallo-hydrolase [Longimicrobiales bacterium]
MLKPLRSLFATIIVGLVTILTFAPPAMAQAAADAQEVPPPRDPRIYGLIESASAERIERDIRILAGFGTRNTYSDTLSDSRGIGAARRWIRAEFDRISTACGGCLDVYYQEAIFQGRPQGSTDPQPVNVVNVVAVLRGTTHPDHYVIMAGDIDSRASNTADFTSDAPGANDNASGMAGVLEAARMMTQHRYGKSVVFVGLSGEEQGLWGGQHMAQQAIEDGWVIEAVLNNDMIGNIEGIDGVINNTVFRVFSEPTPVTETEQERRARRTRGGEVDGVSRQLARYVDRITSEYFTNLDAMMIYRLDRFGRGGHHRPFNDAGFPGIRIMEAHENYTRQHQNIRVEDGIEYGDVVEGVNFDYAARLTAVNVATLAALAWAPPPPDTVRLTGAVRPSATLNWTAVDSPALAGYKVYWRLTTEPQWTNWVYVGNITEYTLQNLIIDNYVFGVAAVARNGNESPVVFGR